MILRFPAKSNPAAAGPDAGEDLEDNPAMSAEQASQELADGLTSLGLEGAKLATAIAAAGLFGTRLARVALQEGLFEATQVAADRLEWFSGTVEEIAMQAGRHEAG